MNRSLFRLGALASLSLAGSLSDLVAQDAEPSPVILQTQPDDAASPSPEALVNSAHADASGRRLAPRGTFYLLEYVSAKTDKGVDGFPPGHEVHFVEAHRDTQTLVVSDGRAQVEVSPSKLTNDLGIAALVRKNDQAAQAQIAAYVQAEQAAYNKSVRDAAVNTAKDIEDREAKRAADEARAAQARQDQVSQPVNTGIVNGGYYGVDGYGGGSPYSFLGGGSEMTITLPQTVAAPAPAAPAAAPAAPPNKVTAPTGNSGGVRPR